MSTDTELVAYWRDSASWDADRVRQWRETARTWRWVAGGGWLCAIAASVALVALMPLKRVDPFVIRVDNTTGIVDVVPSYVGTTDVSQVVTRYLLTHYIGVCERFNFSTAESDYQECGAFNSAPLNQQWYALWKRTNPASPLNLYRDGSTVRAEVVSVSFLKSGPGQGLAQIRFARHLRQSPDAAEQVTHWIAAVQYSYSTPAHDPRLRSLNPLGFKVMDYHTEQEAPADLEAAHVVATTSGAGAKGGSALQNPGATAAPLVATGAGARP